MNPEIPVSSLDPDDINGIQQVYGVQDNAPSAYDMSEDRRDLNILQSTDGITVNANALDNDIDGSGRAERINGAEGADRIAGRGGSDTLSGGRGDDTLFGGTRADTLRGNAGADSLVGQRGEDLLKGGNGNDRLFGNRDDDTLNGGAGRDLLNGGGSDDRLTGGAGLYTSVFAYGHGDDTIADFAATNNGEKIDLSAVSAITGINDLMNNHATQAGADVLIDTGGGNSILLQNVALGDLGAGDFLF